MNATGMTTGGRLTRRELSQVRSEFRRMTTPTERLNHRIDLLSKAYKTGAISQAEYHEGTRRLRSEMPAAEQAGSKMLATMRGLPGPLGSMAGQIERIEGMGPRLAAVTIGVGAMVAAYRAGLGVIRTFTGEIRGQIDAVTDLSQRARALGTSVSEMVTFQTLLSQDAGIGHDRSAQMFTVMAKRIGEAADGTGKAQRAMAILNLDAAELVAMDPAQAFRHIVDAAHRLENPIDRAVVATGLFGNEGAKIAAIFRDGVDAIDAARDATERWGLAIDDVDAKMIELLDENLGRQREQVSGAARGALAEMAPTLVTMTRETGLIKATVEGTVEAFKVLAGFDKVRVAANLIEDQEEFRREIEQSIAEQKELDGTIREGEDLARKIEEQEEEAARRREQIDARRLDLQKELEAARRQAIGTRQTTVEQQMAELRAMGATADQLREMAELHREIAAIRHQQQQREAAEQKQREQELNRKAREREAEQERQRGLREAEQRRSAMQREADSIRRAFAAPQETLAERFVELHGLARAGMISVREMVLARNAAARDLVSDPAMGGVTTAGAFSADAQRAMFEQQQQERRERIEQARAERLMREADDLARREGRRLRATEQITEQMERQAAAAARINPSPAVGGPAGGSGGEVFERIAVGVEATAAAVRELEPVVGV